MAARRELIEPQKGDKRYVRRNKKGQFKESEDVGRSLSTGSFVCPQRVLGLVLVKRVLVGHFRRSQF